MSATTPQPRTLSFAASKDHADVAEYVFEIFKAGADPRTQPAVHAETLGKPAVVDGRITHDVQRVIEALGTGSYFATVSAVNAGGRSRSAPSNTFTR